MASWDGLGRLGGGIGILPTWKRGQLSCARILAGENLPLAPKKRMCIAIALLLHRIGEEGKKVRGAWDKSGGSGCVSWRARRARSLGAVNGWDYHKYTTKFSELQRRPTQP